MENEVRSAEDTPGPCIEQPRSNYVCNGVSRTGALYTMNSQRVQPEMGFVMISTPYLLACVCFFLFCEDHSGGRVKLLTVACGSGSYPK